MSVAMHVSPLDLMQLDDQQMLVMVETLAEANRRH